MNIRPLQTLTYLAVSIVFWSFGVPVSAQLITYSTWTNGIAWAGSDSSPGADPNSDRVKNLMAYAMDLPALSTPTSSLLPSCKAVPADATNSAGLAYTYRVNAKASDIDFHITTATNLCAGSWASLDASGITSSVETVNADIDGDGSARLMQTRISSSGFDSARFLRLEATLYEIGASNRLGSWTGTLWSLAGGQTAFTGTVNTATGYAEFIFSDPLAGVGVNNPDSPDFSTASSSFFGVEGTGFGVNESTVGRFDRGESFTIQSDRDFQLKSIGWAEYSGDEAVHLSWFCNGMPRSSTVSFDPGTSSYTETPFFGVFADSNTPLRITNVSDSSAGANGRLRVNYIDAAVIPPPAAPPEPMDLPNPVDPALCGAALILSDWTQWPWNGTNGALVLSGTMTAPENGGTPAVFTFTAQDDIDVINLSLPDFSAATPDYFGFESTGFGVGDPTTGRFDRGEAITLTCSHAYILDVIRWREVDGDEQLHISWTSGGIPYGGVFDIENASTLTNMTVDANTDLVIINVSPDTSPLSGRLRIQDIKAQAVYDTEPGYDHSGPDGFVQMAGVNLAGAEFGGAAFWQTDTNQWNYYHSKGLDLIRLPFKWERIQTGFYQPVDFTNLDKIAALAHERGMKVVLDMHNYDRYTSATVGTNIVIGTAAVPNEAFADVWRQIADHYRDETAIYGYGLMNEPHSTGGLWPASAQAATDAIREVDTNHWVIVGGENWSSAYSWRGSNPGLDITDAYGKVMYEAHAYFDTKYPPGDGDYSSYDSENPIDDKGVYQVNPFILWLQEHHARGFIGEFGTPKTDVRWNRVLEPVVSHIAAYGLNSTYWAGGKNWGNYQLDCSPTSDYTVDSIQMDVLEQHIP